MKSIPLHSASPPPAPPAAGQERWRFGWLYAAPHRLAFAAGALMLAASALWWAAMMLARTTGTGLAWGLPPTITHGLWMSFGFMPLFFTGFLFTAGPKWLGLPAVDALTLRAPIAAQVAGWAVLLMATHAPDPAEARVLGSLGLLAAGVGWATTTARFVAMVRRSRAADRVHAITVAAACCAGVLTLLAAAVALALGRFDLVRLATLLALWVFIGVVYVSVAHRMIPFFSASALPVLDAWRPMWLLAVFVVALLLQAAFVLAETLAWPLAPAWRVAQAAIEAPAALLMLALALRWGLVQSLKVRLLAMLHVGFFWFGVALALSAASHALMAISDGATSLGLAPLHAYTMGFLGSTLIAMATRVSAGHSGRALAADDFVWRLFWLLQLAIGARLIGAVSDALGWPTAPILATAAGLWALAVTAWALRYGRWYGRARVDGRPG